MHTMHIIWHLSFYTVHSGLNTTKIHNMVMWLSIQMFWCHFFQVFRALSLNFSTITCRKPFWIYTKLLFVHMVDIMPNRNKYVWDIRTGQAFHANDNVFKVFYDVYVHSIHIFFSRGGPKTVLTELCLFLTLRWLFNLNCWHKLTSCGLPSHLFFST